ncbi:MAG TPA: hypothetical protein VLF60_05290 [Candidatus Saccharimonadales bacterium]|nr:hypothetical protein [Candidatus Saccharimonadales bacterium]
MRQKLHVLGVLFRPSPLSFIVSMTLSIAILVGSNWSYLVHSPLLYDYFFGPSGLVTVMQDAPDGFTAFTTALFSGSVAYHVVILVIAGGVALLVYVFLETLDRIAASARNAWWGIHDTNRTYSKSVELEVGVRFGVRALSFIVWLIYWFFSAKAVLPFCILMFRMGVDHPYTAVGAKYDLVGVGVLLLTLHIHVILLRLLTLRLRMFGMRPELYEL